MPRLGEPSPHSQRLARKRRDDPLAARQVWAILSGQTPEASPSDVNSQPEPIIQPPLSQRGIEAEHTQPLTTSPTSISERRKRVAERQGFFEPIRRLWRGLHHRLSDETPKDNDVWKTME